MLFTRWHHHIRFGSGFPYASFKAMLTKISKFPDHPQNWITCSFCHSRHFLKISERSFHNFLSYVADTQTNKQTNYGKNITFLAKVIILMLFTGSSLSTSWIKTRPAQKLPVRVKFTGNPYSYVCDFLSVSDLRSRQKLRSASTAALVIPVTRHSTLGYRPFPVIAAKLWNALPGDITSATSLLTFRHKLKTFLFRRSYGEWLFWYVCVFCLSVLFFGFYFLVFLRVFIVL